MKTYLECIPCLSRNLVGLAERMTEDPVLRERIVSAGLHALADGDLRNPPPLLAREMMDKALEISNFACPDPYCSEKEKSTALAVRLLEHPERMPEYDSESFEDNLRLAVAGNLIDFCISGNFDPESAMETVRRILSEDVPDRDAVARLKQKMDSAKTILYLLDNCGEAVFDRAFMAPYREKIILGIRGLPAFNDVTHADLESSGLAAFAGKGIVDNATGIPGTVLSHAGDAFRKAFDHADLILAKGQGNFETLNETPGPIVFLFLAKCPVVIRLTGASRNSIQIRFQTPWTRDAGK